MVEREELVRSRIARDHEQSSIFAVNAASCSTRAKHARSLSIHRCYRSTFRLVSMHANSV
jgi:hypothetical protein